MSVIPEFIGISNFSNTLREVLSTFSRNNVFLMLQGEKGTGKRLFAQKMHSEKSLGLKFFFEINCRVLSDVDIHYMLEKILSSDSLDKPCTVFINNIEYLSQKTQLELLAFIYKIQINAEQLRIISSSSVDLSEYVKKGTFNTELFVLLSKQLINFVPLRQRREDILPIANYYFERFNKDSGFNLHGFEENAKNCIEQYDWFGNCDELINSIQRGFIVSKNKELSKEDLGIKYSSVNVEIQTNTQDKTLKTAIDNFKKYYITKILEENDNNQTKTAKILGLQRTYVVKLMGELGIRK